MSKFKLIPPSAPLITTGDLWTGLKSMVVSRGAISDFERAFCRFQGLKYVHFLSSGRAALYTILMTLRQNSSRRDVIIPAFICPVVASSIIEAGCKAVPCDISKDSLDYNLTLLRRIVSPSTLCIVAVHLCGMPCHVDEILRIAKEKNTFIVEDCAHAVGSSLNNKMLGTFGDFSFFSFGKGKCMTTGNGGAVGTMSHEFYKTFKETLLNLVNNKPQTPISTFLGLIGYVAFTRPFLFNLIGRFLCEMLDAKISPNFRAAKFSDFQAAIGLSVIQKMNKVNSQRIEKALYLFKRLCLLKTIRIPKILPNAHPNFLRFPILVRSKDIRERLLKIFKKNNIKAGILYGKSINMIKDFNINGLDQDYGGAKYVADRIITLPTHQFVTKKDLDTMIDIIESLS